MNNQVTLQDTAKIIDRLGRYFPMLVRNGSEVVNDWYPFIAQFPLDVAQAAAMYVIENTAFDPPKPAVFVQAARMLLQHQTGQRELTAAEAWHAACKQLNPYKKPHYENKLVSQAVHDIVYLNLCTAEHDMFSVLSTFITFCCSVKRMSLRSKVLLPVSACVKVISQKSKPNETIPADTMRQRGLFF